MGAGGLGPPPEMPDITTRTQDEVDAGIDSDPRNGYMVKPVAIKEKTSWAPGRKFLAAGTGLGLGTNISIVLAYYFPDMPATVTAAYGGIVLYFVTLLVTYLVPPE